MAIILLIYLNRFVYLDYGHMKRNRFSGCMYSNYLGKWLSVSDENKCWYVADYRYHEKLNEEKAELKNLKKSTHLFLVAVATQNATVTNQFRDKLFVDFYNIFDCEVDSVEITLETPDISRIYYTNGEIVPNTVGKLEFSILDNPYTPSGKYSWFVSNISFSTKLISDEIACYRTIPSKVKT